MIPQACHPPVTYNNRRICHGKESGSISKRVQLAKVPESVRLRTKCKAKLYKYHWPNGFECPKYGHNTCYELKTRQLFQCIHYRYQCSITSGTIFDSSQLPLTTWFLGIYLITQAKDGMSALSLRGFLDISVNTAVKMKHKLRHVMKNADDHEPPCS
ncbi:transposase [Desulfosediminicola flagellatus]|uniref:transposase n=1 Tax=Desulfosediminicola flagellatus TaxID=2569541 RepID=UPI00142F053D